MFPVLCLSRTGITHQRPVVASGCQLIIRYFFAAFFRCAEADVGRP